MAGPARSAAVGRPLLLLLLVAGIAGWRFDALTQSWQPDPVPAAADHRQGYAYGGGYQHGYQQQYQPGYQQHYDRGYHDVVAYSRDGKEPQTNNTEKQPMESKNKTKEMDPMESKEKKKSMECKNKAKSGRCLTRKERELLLPNGFMLAFEPKVAFNLYNNDKMGLLRILVKTDIQYQPPANLVDAAGRSMQSSKMMMDKQIIYNTFKATITRFGADGDACLQRAVCEVAEAPLRRDGIIGEILNMVLSPSHRLEQAESSEVADLLAAEQRGREMGECHLAYPRCPLSLFNVIDSASDYTGSILDALAEHGQEPDIS